MVACNMPHSQIAVAIGCDQHTLYKYFQDNLDNGKARKRQELYDWIFKSAKKGNIGAQRKLAELIDGGMLGQDILDHAAEAKDAPAKEEKLGKKEQALKDAKQPDLTTTLGELMAMRERGRAVN